MEIQTRIDWLGYTVPSGEYYIRDDMMDLGFGQHRPGCPHSQYDRTFDCKNGTLVRENFDPENRQGTYVEMRGETLAGLPYDVQAQIAIWVDANAQSVARADLTLDMFFDNSFEWVSPLHWRSLFHSKMCKTRVTSESLQDSTRHRNYAGMTWTLGSTKSDRFVRIYDKAAELRVPDMFWTRFEMQCRNKFAESSLGKAAQFGLQPTVKRALNQYCEFYHPAWRAAMDMDGAPAAFEHLHRRKETDVPGYIEFMYKRLMKEVGKSSAHRSMVLEGLAGLQWRLFELSKNYEWEEENESG